jgi:hypothetical protein
MQARQALEPHLMDDFLIIQEHGNVLRVLDTIKAAGANKISMAIDVTGADKK